MPAASAGAGRAQEAPRPDLLRSRAERAWQDAQAAWALLQAVHAQKALAAAKPSRQQLLTVSVYARLQAKLATMPVIEQAKGVLMAQQRCEPGEAFDLLRRASQRSNVPVRVLAEQIVKNAQQRRAPK